MNDRPSARESRVRSRRPETTTYGTLTKSSMKDRAVSVSFRNAHEIELHRPVSPSATATATLVPGRKNG